MVHTSENENNMEIGRSKMHCNQKPGELLVRPRLAKALTERVRMIVVDFESIRLALGRCYFVLITIEDKESD